MKKFLGFVLAGAMVISMSVPVFAAVEMTQIIIHTNGTVEKVERVEISPGLYQTRYSVSYDADYDAEALAAKEMGLSMDVLQGAEEANKSVGEYMNNAVNGAAGIADATPVAQGGNVIINGEPSNQTFSVNKPLAAHVDAAKAQAAAVGGRVMNCVDVDAGVYFDVATVNFYTPGITGAENVQVYHFSGGQWLPVNVVEVREDHIVVDMTAPGILAFIEMPVEAAE